MHVVALTFEFALRRNYTYQEYNKSHERVLHESFFGIENELNICDNSQIVFWGTKAVLYLLISAQLSASSRSNFQRRLCSINSEG